MGAVMSLGGDVGKKAACESLSIPRSTLYRHISPKKPEVKQGCLPPLALSDEERQQVLAVCHLERFWDSAPRQIYATLLDEGLYYCSVSTMYRILREHNEIKERRNQVNRPHYEKPELLAIGPNQIWSWDITKLKGPVKWT
jgi:putative transposase